MKLARFAPEKTTIHRPANCLLVEISGEIMQDNKYCVYLHRRKDNNDVFYGGSGTSDRPKSKHRSNTWLEYTQNCEYYIDIVQENLSLSDARDLEQEYLKEHSETVINKVGRVAKTYYLDLPIISEYLKYDEFSSSGLVWIKDVLSGQNFNRKIATCGAPAGFKVSDGSWRVGLKGKVYLAHRIIFALNTGRIDDKLLVDHIDGDRSNNHIDNLREVTYAVNMRNRKKVDNRSGVTGVYFTSVPSGNKTSINEYYMACVYLLDGKCSSKRYSISKYGKEEAFRLACQWRKEQIEQLNANGAGYTDRHGT